MARRNLNGTAGSDWINATALSAADHARSLLGDGNDRFDGSAGGDQAFGENGNDLLFGHAGDDSLVGAAGADQLQGGAGHDTLDGGDDDDILGGGDGNDSVRGGAGRDNIQADAGDDRVDAGDGDDTVVGGAGNDTILGGAGNDRLDGGEGDDSIAAGEGDNAVDGGAGHDSITAGAGHDWISGGEGNDTIKAGAGRNTVHAGAGNDRVEAGAGDDAISGDDGNDVVLAGDGNNTVHAGLGNDRVETGGGTDNVTGDDGDDTLLTGGGNDTAHAGTGADSLDLGAGDDIGTGDDGNDTVLGGDGRDTIQGGAGNDVLNGGRQVDLIVGDDGDDLVIQAISDVAAGRDQIHGAGGTDTLRFAFTAAQWFDLANQAELARLVGLDGTASVRNGGQVVTNLFGATYQGFESLSASVDGIILSAEDDAVTARDDLFLITESGVVAASVLANDTVPDLVRDVTLVGPAPTPGNFSLGATGLLNFATAGAFESLRAGETRDLAFTYKVRDADLDSATATATIRITGENDAATITGPSTGTVTEDTPAATTVSGTLTVSDVDTGENVFRTPASLAGTYGAFSFDSATGAWSYALDNARAATQALDTGVSVFETLTVTSLDGTATRMIKVKVEGRNDGPVIMGSTGDFTVTERADGAADENAGSIAVAGRAMTFTDADAADAHTATVTLQSGPGLGVTSVASVASSAAGSTGTVTWDYGVLAASLDSLAGGETLVEKHRVRVSDGDTTAQQNVTVRLVGANDAVRFTAGDEALTVTDGGITEGSGAVGFADPDLRDTHILTVTPPAGALGTFGATITEGNDGDGIGAVGWSFTVDEDAIRFLGANEAIAQTYTLMLKDLNLGAVQTTATRQVTVTINGTNDAPDSLELLGEPSVEEGIAGLGGRFVAVVAATDPDASDALTFTVSDSRFEVVGGALFLKAGEWLDFETEPSVTLSVTATDTGNLSITEQFVIGVDDVGDARSLDGQMIRYAYQYPNAGLDYRTDVTPGAGVELPGIYVQPGDPTNTSVDVEGDRIIVDFGDNLTWGSGFPNGFTFADLYDNLAPIVGFELVRATNLPGLSASNLSFTTDSVSVNWGGMAYTTESVAEFRIVFGAIHPNLAASVTGDTTGSVTEDAAANTATGTLTVTDTDPGEAIFAALDPASLNGTYGTWAFDIHTGAWTYALDNARAATQGLGAGATATDILAVKSYDGANGETITVTVNGVNDAATIGGTDTGAVMEDGTGVVMGALTVADPDLGETAFSGPVFSAGSYGAFIFNPGTGGWFYTLDNANTSVQALGAGDTQVETMTVASLDGTAHTISVTVNGTNDTAFIAGSTGGTVSEDGQLSFGGNLSVSDADAGESDFAAVDPATLIGTYGSFTFDAGTKVWSYVLNNASTAVQSLGVGQSVTDSFTITSLDGSATQAITVAVNGANDPPTPTSIIIGHAVSFEGDAPFTVDALATSTDLDGEALSVVDLPATLPAGVTYDPVTHSFTLDPGDPAYNHLGTGLTNNHTVVSVTYGVSDGHLPATFSALQWTITGTNDAAIIGAPSVASVTEDTNVVGGFLKAIGSISIADPEAGQAFFDTTVAGANGNLGSLTLAPDGNYTYQVPNAAVQYLGQGQSKVDTFDLTSLDGTTKQVAFTVNGKAEGTPVTMTFTALTNGSANNGIYSEGGFTLTPTGNHTDGYQTLYFHDGGFNPGDNDLILTAANGAAFSIVSLDLLRNDSGFQIITANGTFTAASPGSDIAVGLTNITSARFEADDDSLASINAQWAVELDNLDLILLG